MKGQKRPNFKRRYIMRWLLSLIFVIVTLSSASATETKTEFITEEVCHAVAGCWINPKTGECPDCVTETRKIVTVINVPKKKEIKKISNKNHVMIASIPTKKFSRNDSELTGKCIVGVCAWKD